ncbi:MAG: molybdopterin molybdotransferase MoeA [Clostridium sp.]|uniref:molybdopterin molybdotransferase MoeA n=1 Tax=Clostridium sp. TaxID=1506 RepID=UPI002FCC9F53
MIRNIKLEDATTLLLSKVKPLPLEDINILQLQNRILGKDIVSSFNIPPFNRSPLDGYALISSNIQGSSKEAPAKLHVIAEVAAGEVFHGEVINGQAVKIMTGAPIPEGADTVIRKEDTDEGIEFVNIYTPLKPYSNYAFSGEDVKSGETILTKGQKLDYSSIGMLASLGHLSAMVYEKPKVSILSTGSELTDLGNPLLPGKIYNSNLYSIGALVESLGCTPLLLPSVNDEVNLIAEKMEESLKHSNILITTGGASVGDYDLIAEALRSISANILFHRIAMKPGTPVIAAEKDGKLIIGLSGNPAAALISFELVARPILLRMAGIPILERPTIKGILVDDFNKTSSQRRFLRVIATKGKTSYEIKLAGKQNPGVLKSMISCNGLIDIPPKTSLESGQEVEVIMLMDGVY